MKHRTKLYADRVTMFWTVGETDDAVVFHEVTREERKDEGLPDFDTIAWCPTEKAARIVKRALDFYRDHGGRL